MSILNKKNVTIKTMLEKIKMVKMVNIKLFIIKHLLMFYYEKIHWNPNFWYKLLFLYRFISGFILLLITIDINSMYICDFLYGIYVNCIYDVSLHSFRVNIEGYTSGNVSTGTNFNGSSGPSGPGGNNPTGVESSIENENSRRRLRPKMHSWEAEGSCQYGYDHYVLDHKLIHSGVEPDYYGDNVCVYRDGGVEWIYKIDNILAKDFNYCIVKYPDGSRCYMSNKLAVMANVKYHRALQSLLKS